MLECIYAVERRLPLLSGEGMRAVYHSLFNLEPLPKICIRARGFTPVLGFDHQFVPYAV